MIFNDVAIREVIKRGYVVRASRELIQPASLDVRLGDRLRDYVTGETVGDVAAGHRLMPGDCVLGSTVEILKLPDNIVARIEGKSSWARMFLTVHSAGFIDPGFRGEVTLELKNDGRVPIELTARCVIAQVSFHTMVGPAERPYGSPGLGSHYQGQLGPTLSAIHRKGI